MERKRHLDRKDIFVLLCGLALVVRIQIVGTLLLSEFLLITYFFSSKLGNINAYVKKFYVFGVLWLIGTIISNVVNQVNITDSIKGVFAIVILLLLIAPIYQLVSDKPERLLLFFIGSGISGLLMPYFSVSEEQGLMWQADVFRFYSYAGLVSAFCYYYYFRGKRMLALFVLEFVSIVGLFNDSRNLFLTTTVSAIIIFYSIRFNDKIRFFASKMPVMLISMLFGLLIIDYVYENLASSGILGEKAYNKYTLQKSGGNLLEGGRTATFMGIELIKEKPITGWGSYARDTWGFKERYHAKHNTEYYDNPYVTPLLPSHSYVVGAWMQNGILGGLFWFWVLFMLWKVFKSGCLLCEPRILCLLMCQFIALLWNWAFSPFGDRVTFLFLFLTYIAIYDNYTKRRYSLSANSIKKLKL